MSIYEVHAAWQHPPLTPALHLNIARESTYSTPALVRSVTRTWLLDFTFTPCGKYRVGINARTAWLDRAAHCCHLFAPGTTVTEDTRGTKVIPIHYAFYMFRGDDSRLRKLVNNPTGHARFLDSAARIGKAICETARVGQQAGLDGYWPSLGQLYSVVDVLSQASPVSPGLFRIPDKPDVPHASTLVQSVDRFFNEHLSAHLSLTDAAKALNLAKSTLCHQYRQETGIAPMKRLTQLRISVARDLLLKGHSIKTIAVNLGFVDASHFCRVFKSFTGISPTQFRRGEGVGLNDSDMLHSPLDPTRS